MGKLNGIYTEAVNQINNDTKMTEDELSDFVLLRKVSLENAVIAHLNELTGRNRNIGYGSRFQTSFRRGNIRRQLGHRHFRIGNIVDRMALCAG